MARNYLLDTKYIVVVKTAAMPQSCKGRYKRIAVVEVDIDDHKIPPMISLRCRAIRSIAATYERLHYSGTGRGVFYEAMAEAEALAARLNKKARRNRLRRDRYHAKRAQQATGYVMRPISPRLRATLESMLG